MRNKEERHSPVKVKVVDFSQLEKEATEELKKKKPDRKVIKAEIRFAWAYVDTPKGIIALNSEGVGCCEPISKEYPLELEVYGKYESDKGEGSYSFDIFPVFGYRIDDPNDITELPYEEKPLSEFIRRFGSRLESNYHQWEKLLMETGVAV